MMQNVMPALTASTSLVDGDAAGRLNTRGEPSAQATFRGPKSNDRGESCERASASSGNRRGGREKILVHLAKLDTE